MRNVSHKPTSLRTAIAVSTLRASPETIVAIREGNVPKGDPLPIAKVAAIQAAKKTAEWIPYCHNIPIEGVAVDFEIEEAQIRVEVSVTSVAKTGVEIEAMTAAAAATLTLYDMLKMIDDDMSIGETRLLIKLGGKSSQRSYSGWSAQIIVASDRATAGEMADVSGEVLRNGFCSYGASHVGKAIVPDECDDIRNAVRSALERNVQIIVVAGGTGLSARDVTPEALNPVFERRLPGVEEALRSYSQSRMGAAMLSRSVAGVSGKSIILGIPGSPGACEDALSALFPQILHAIEVLS